MDPFTALADPTRRRIVELLGAGEQGAGGLGGHFTISPPAVSQHLKILREAGLIRVRSEGQRRIYSLHPDGLSGMEAWIAKVRGFWGERLDALENELSKGDMP